MTQSSCWVWSWVSPPNRGDTSVAIEVLSLSNSRNKEQAERKTLSDNKSQITAALWPAFPKLAFLG